MKKTIYLVRHGETEGNRHRVHQSETVVLNGRGKEQAKQASALLKGKNIQALFTSPYTRTRETAEIVSSEVGVPYEIIDSLTEFQRPQYLHGRHHYSLRSLWYLFLFIIRAGDPHWDDEYSESMLDIQNRIYDTMKLIASRKEESIVIVSHAIFITTFLQIACNTKSISVFQFLLILLKVKSVPNGSVTTMIYDPDALQGICAWSHTETKSV